MLFRMKGIIFASALAISVLPLEPVAIAPATVPASQAAPQPGAGAEPLVVLIAYDPWAMVIGSDTPRFVLYDDGVVIYRTDAGHYSARLTPDQVATFNASLRPDALAERAGTYTAVNATDQPTTDILVRRKAGYARVSVYGSLRSPFARAATPDEFLDAYERLAAFESPGAIPWLPEAVEVMIWPYEYAPDESIVWPETWPGVDHADTVQRGDSHSLYIPAAEYPELRDFLRTRREKGAVLIDGRKWIAQVRLPFPKEDRWMNQPEGP